MSIIRPIAGLFLFASVLSGCAISGFPNIKSRYSSAAQNAEWPSFLPIETILKQGTISSLDQGPAGLSSLQSRVSGLKKRAKLLRRPVVQGYERVRLLQAVSQRQP